MYTINPEEHLKTRGIIDLNKKSNVEIKQSENIVIPTLVQHQLDVEDDERQFKHDNYWVSGCLKMDKRAVVFFSQLAISLSICAFTIGMMSFNQDCATFSRFSPLLTLVVGIWLPQPSMKSDK